MKHIIVATFVIIALGSTIKSEAKAFHFFPFRFDYNRDKTNDGSVKTLVYSSPFTGKTYNWNYVANWSPVTLPPLPPPPPKSYTWDFNWNFNHGHGHGSGVKTVVVNKDATSSPTTTTTTTTTTAAPESTTVSSKSGSYNGKVGHHNVDVKWSYDFNHGGSATTSSTTETSSTEKPIKDDENEQVKEDVSSENETILDDASKAKENDHGCDCNPTSEQDH